MHSIIDSIKDNDPSYNPLTTALVKSKVDRDTWRAACSRVYTDGYYGPISDEEWREQDGREPSNVKEAIKVIATVLAEVDDYKFENEYGYFEVAEARLIRAELVPFYKEIYGIGYPQL